VIDAKDVPAWMGVDQLISDIKAAVRESGVSRERPHSDMRVESVQLILKTVAVRTAGGGVDFRIPVIGLAIKAGLKLTRQDIHTIDVTLKPPQIHPDAARATSENVQETLVQAIKTVRKVVNSGSAGDGDPWVLSTGRIDIEFIVAQNGVISLGLDSELTGDISHTLRLGLVPSRRPEVPAQGPLPLPVTAPGGSGTPDDGQAPATSGL
jgi:hypothetical protein